MSNQQDTKKKNPNVPTLRFPRFSDQWHQTEIGALVEINPRNKKDIPDSFLYIDLESVKRGELVKHVISDKKGAPSRAQRLLEEGDILYSCVRPYQHNNYLFTDSQTAVASTGFACLRGAECPEFLYQLLNTDRFTNAVLERCTGTSYPAINSTDLSSIKVMLPSKNEQLAIGTLIGLIDSKITVQNKIIEELSTLIIQLCRTMRTSQDCHLGDLCSCKTSQIKEGDLQPVGQYPVYGAAGLAGRLDTFEFSKPGIAIIKDGAGVGRSYEIKSEHYSVLGTMALLLPNDGVPTSFLWAAVLGLNFKSYVVGSGIPHIYFKNYSHAEIAEPSTYNITLSRLISLLKGKRENAEEALTSLQSQKAFFLANMFI